MCREHTLVRHVLQPKMRHRTGKDRSEETYLESNQGDVCLAYRKQAVARCVKALVLDINKMLIVGPCGFVHHLGVLVFGECEIIVFKLESSVANFFDCDGQVIQLPGCRTSPFEGGHNATSEIFCVLGINIAAELYILRLGRQAAERFKQCFLDLQLWRPFDAEDELHGRLCSIICHVQDVKHASEAGQVLHKDLGSIESQLPLSGVEIEI